MDILKLIPKKNVYTIIVHDSLNNKQSVTFSDDETIALSFIFNKKK